MSGVQFWSMKRARLFDGQAFRDIFIHPIQIIQIVLHSKWNEGSRTCLVEQNLQRKWNERWKDEWTNDQTCTFPDCICCHQRFGTWIKIGIIFQVFFKRNNFFFLKKIKQVELSPFKKILYFQVFVSPFVTCKVCSRCVYDATVTNIIVLLRCSHGDDDHHHILCTI